MSRLLTALLLLASIAHAEEPTFEGLGQAPVTAGDRVRARERALDEALRQAVEQAAATLLDPQALAQKASDLKLRVYPKARQYVVTYRVLDEGENGGVFQLHVSAQVSTARLARDLESTQVQLPRLPFKLRAVVCARAKTEGGDGAALAAEAEKQLRELMAARSVESLPRTAECSDALAADAARAGSAQGALVAEIEAGPSGPIRGTTMLGAHARATVRLVEPGGRVSASENAQREAYGANVDRALAAAAREATAAAIAEVSPRLTAMFPAQSPSGGVRVRLTGVSRYAHYAAVVRALGSAPGVSGVEARRFARGEAELWVRTQQAAQQLAGVLGRLVAGGVKLTARPAGDGSLTVEVSGSPVPEGG